MRLGMFKNQMKPASDHRKAQSAIELAIFGGIMIFIISLIIKSGMTANIVMNQELRAMRLAMRLAYSSSAGGSAQRNNAAVLLVEDRLWVNPSGKFLDSNRIPMVTQAQVVHGKNLFMPIDWGETQNLPIFDLIVNGAHFELRVADFVTYSLTEGSIPYCTDSPRVAQSGSGNTYGYSVCWDNTCPIAGGCAILHTVNLNFPANTNWDPNCDECFDLNFDGTVDVSTAPDPHCLTGGGTERDCFMWQWRQIYAVQDQTAGATGPLEGINADPTVQHNVSVDVDGDYKDEGIKGVGVDALGRITTASVMDYEAGDSNLNENDRDHDLTGADLELFASQDARMYSIDPGGTTYEIREGHLFNPADGQYVRQTNRQNHVDIIERTIQLSRNTGHYCEPSGIAHAPVEVCASDCFIPANIQRICMDTDNNKVFVRSRIYDLRQRRWVTRVSR